MLYPLFTYLLYPELEAWWKENMKQCNAHQLHFWNAHDLTQYSQPFPFAG